MGIEMPEGHPEWIGDIVRVVGDSMQPLGVLGQLGFRYLEPTAEINHTGRWLIAIYCVPTELSGGPKDGASVLPGFCLNLRPVLALFSDLVTVEWRVPRSYTDGLAGPEVWIEGSYRGAEAVQLHIYADCPSDEMAALVWDVVTDTLRVK